jgi:hypothetical protein
VQKQQAAAAADGSAAAADSASKYLKDLSVGDGEEEEETGGKGKVFRGWGRWGRLCVCVWGGGGNCQWEGGRGGGVDAGEAANI